MMDNTRKRKIVRNFVIGYLLLQVLVIVLYLGFWAVHPGGFVVAENERTLFSYLTYFSAPIIRIGLDGMVVHPIQTHKKGTLHSHFECTVFLLSSFKVGSFTKLNLAF